ncbi:MAG: quinone-dependent dihydroorotate dehydrogenase [Xanthomonadales bacterium]|nr:quinone-dependent dihydroorotate dehydrogenase [Xanthomonadales bacterium]
MYGLARTALFRLPPEVAHDVALNSLRRAHALGLAPLFSARVENRPCTVFGLEFPNPVGLAAGLDKNGDYIEALGAMGFGFIEVGTVTPRPQPGNPKPRVFRIPQRHALINRLGFNNKGVDHLVERLRRCRNQGIVGVNIGKNKDTPNDRAVDDYVHCLRKVYVHSAYITINVSSPNTEGLRDLQSGSVLGGLLDALLDERDGLASHHGAYRPLLVKIAPDLSQSQVEELARLFSSRKPDGVIATNTTVDHGAVAGLPHGDEDGGLSGEPLMGPATDVLGQLRTVLDEDIPLIGVGGILQGADAARKREAGADLVQIYTGFIYRGPELIAECARAMGK